MTTLILSVSLVATTCVFLFTPAAARTDSSLPATELRVHELESTNAGIPMCCQREPTTASKELGTSAAKAQRRKRVVSIPLTGSEPWPY